MESQNNKKPEHIRLSRAIVFVSLDIVFQVYKPLNFCLSNSQQFKEKIRDFVIQFRNETVESSKLQTRLDSFFTKLNFQHELKEFIYWVDNFYVEHGFEFREVDKKNIAIKYYRWNGESSSNSTCISDVIWSKVINCYEGFLIPENRAFLKLVDEIQENHLSDWDLHFFVLNGWNDNSEEFATSPFDTILLIHEHLTIQRFLKKLRDEVPKNELDIFWKQLDLFIAAEPNLKHLL